ncbi:hypothetical protein BVRB_6g140790 [Beta vulgaris subsp. vulgaris]|nr:hypothetical protein BVRB_6g140790 [Beta vulgaris subsp. vulgaris]
MLLVVSSFWFYFYRAVVLRSAFINIQCYSTGITIMLPVLLLTVLGIRIPNNSIINGIITHKGTTLISQDILMEIKHSSLLFLPHQHFPPITVRIFHHRIMED